ncbi:phospholipid carrier-dependent glycosyltransferase [bacterium]|nr:phospholipid carrier-dependent glycosyltransferase [bacterium]
MHLSLQKNKIYILLSIVLIALLLRFINLGTLPAGLNVDEASYLYDAKSFIETGKDKWGKQPDITISEYGSIDNRTPIYIYLSIPFIKIFGYSEFSLRFLSVFLGTLTVLLTFFITKRLANERTAFIATILIAVSPWHIFISRIALEGSLVPFFFTLSLLLLLKSSEKHKYLLYFSVALLSLNIYGYMTNKVFIPLFMAGLIFIYRKHIRKHLKESIYSGIIFALIALPLISATVLNYSTQQGRFNELSITNLGTLWPIIFISNYIQHFGISFFTFGSNLSGIPPIIFSKISFAEYAFFVYGLILLLQNRKRKNSKILILWCLLFPVASSLTIDGIYHGFRSTIALPLIQIITAIAIFDIYKRIKSIPSLKKTLTTAIALIIINLLFILVGFYKNYNFKTANAYEYGLRESLTNIKDVSKSKNIYISDRSSNKNIISQNFIYALIYLDYPPKKFQESKTSIAETGTPGYVQVKKIDNIYFGNIDNYYSNDKSGIFIVREDELPNVAPKKTIQFPDGKIAFKIIYNE